MSRLSLTFGLALALCWPTAARAQDPLPEERPPLRDMTDEQLLKYGFEGVSKGSREGSLEAGLIALGPGTIVHGLGHFAVGDNNTGWDLFIGEMIGLGLIAGGATTVLLVEDSKSVQAVSMGIAQVGGTLFAVTWLADTIGVFRGSENPLPRPIYYDNILHARAGYSFLSADDIPDYFFNLMDVSTQIDLGIFTLRPYALLDLQLKYQEFGLAGEYKTLGSDPNNFVSLEAEVETVRFSDGIFGPGTAQNGSINRGQVSVVWSADMEIVAEHLKNAVNKVTVGFGLAGSAGTRAGLPGDRQIAHFILEEALRVNITRDIHIEPYYVFSEADLIAPTLNVRIRRSRFEVLGYFGTRFAISPSEGLELTIDGSIGGGFSVGSSITYHLF